MDSRTKYARLPFVAIGEQDLYETDDLPEADQLPTREQPFDASIDIIPSGTLDAFRKFENAESGQLESKHSRESVWDRYERLQQETKELLELAEKDVSDGKNKEMIGNLESLATRLQKLSVSPLESGKVVDNVCDSLEKHKKTVKDGDGKSELTQLTKYQFYFRPQFSQLTDYSKLNSLEQRIKKVETILGESDHKLSLLTSFTNDKNLMEAVQVLSAKVAQLDANHLEKIDARLHSITDKLSQISDRKGQMEELEKNNKLAELHQLMVSNEQHHALIPKMIERLETLDQLHEQASQFSATLSYLDALQSRVNDSLDNNDKQLKVLKESLDKNVDSIKSILSDFDQRIKSLK